jgi:hypothetical protein
VIPTPSNTPTLTLTKTCDVQGQVSFVMLDETFTCTSVKVLVSCADGTEYYVATAGGDLWGLDDQAKVVGYLNNPDTYPAGTAYNIGMRLTQALVGIYGPEKVMRLYGAASETASFSDAFKLAVGDDWELVKPKLAATVFALKRRN